MDSDCRLLGKFDTRECELVVVVHVGKRSLVGHTHTESLVIVASRETPVLVPDTHIASWVRYGLELLLR